MTSATISIKVDGARRQNLSVFDLEAQTGDDGLVVGVQDLLSGLALAMRNQVDGLRQAGIPEDTITGLLIDVWPFGKEES